MQRTIGATLIGLAVASQVLLSLDEGCGPLLFSLAWAAEENGDAASRQDDVPESLAEARGRARLLHETLRGALQVVHRDFFLDDESTAIPSRSFEDVFHELERSRNVRVRWLIVNADALNVDHQPADDFEKAAAKALADGQSEFDAVENGVYRFAGSIRLASQCLKCHVANRTNTKDRTAGLVISMSIKSN